MLRNFITILFSLLFSISFAQVPKKASKALSAGQSELLKNNLDRAIQYFNKAVATYPDFKEAYLALYTVYLQKNDGSKALNALEQATKLASKDKPSLLFNTAKLSLEIGEYQKCLTYTDQYLNLNSKDEATRKMATVFKIKSAYSLANQSPSVPLYTILLPKEINTPLPEYLPSVDATLENLVFTRRTDGNEDLYICLLYTSGQFTRNVICYYSNSIWVVRASKSIQVGIICQRVVGNQRGFPMTTGVRMNAPCTQE